MRDAVRNAFVGFTVPMEGSVPFMYLDVRGLVTCAIGLLVEPVYVALALPWRRQDGSAATQSDIVQDWSDVKASQDMRLRGGWAFRNVAKLRLDEAGIQSATMATLHRMESHLMSRFPKWDEWPADAQLATLSMSWACGPAFNFPNLVASLQQQDWFGASTQCHIRDTDNPGVKPRNAANTILYQNAAVVAHDGLDLDVLQWPRDLWTSTPDVRDTMPAEMRITHHIPNGDDGTD